MAETNTVLAEGPGVAPGYEGLEPKRSFGRSALRKARPAAWAAGGFSL